MTTQKKDAVDSTQVPVSKEEIENASKEAAKAQLPKFKKEELLKIFDEILFSGEYVETYTIKGKLKVSFKSKTADETSAITQDIDAKQFALVVTLQQYRALQNLAYSLVNYAGKDLLNVSIEERKKIIGKLPSAIVAAISEKLSEFDLKVDMACQEGEENF